MINVDDAMLAVAKQLPEDGLSLREFITRTAKICGHSDDAIEAAIALWVEQGGEEDDIVKIGEACMKMN